MITPLGAMKIAIEEAEKGLGFVAPNPPVGCVILDKNQQIIAKGYHQFFGGPHAEVEALNKIENTEQLRGATVYVTLEPCAHEGKTPSCAKALAKLPIAKVVYGLVDPNPLVAGQGIEILKAAGIEAEQSSFWLDELEDLAEIFLYNQQQKKTFVALKIATTLDGQMAHITGDSKWLTGDLSREHVHELRAQYDAVLVGKNTFMRDNPQLNVRHVRYPEYINKVCILDTHGETFSKLEKSKLAKVHKPENIFVITKKEVSQNGGQSLDLNEVLNYLYEQNMRSVFVEGGPTVASQFLQQNLVQRYYQFIAPQIIGAKSGINFSKDFSTHDLTSRKHLKRVHTRVIGQDVLVTGRLN